MKLFDHKESIVQEYRKFSQQDVIIDIKREDLLHPEVSGNKLRKLKYNLKSAVALGHDGVTTFGGAYSNHIVATAAACSILGLKSVGVIRGEELGKDLNQTLKENSTLSTAVEYGMKLHFMSREAYKEKESDTIQNQLLEHYGRSYLIPEGGTNQLAVKGTSEILTEKELRNFQFICVAAGTGGTAAGIIESSAAHQHVLVFSALKGDFLAAEIKKYTNRTNFTLFSEENFGGYAKSSDVLIEYMNVRFRESEIPLDPIYTGKMMYRIEQMVQEGFFQPKTRILAVHTGGLQGISGYNRRLNKKGRALLEYEDYI